VSSTLIVIGGYFYSPQLGFIGLISYSARSSSCESFELPPTHPSTAVSSFD